MALLAPVGGRVSGFQTGLSQLSWFCWWIRAQERGLTLPSWKGVAHLWQTYAAFEAQWMERFSRHEIERFGWEMEALPQCGNDGK